MEVMGGVELTAILCHRFSSSFSSFPVPFFSLDLCQIQSWHRFEDSYLEWEVYRRVKGNNLNPPNPPPSAHIFGAAAVMMVEGGIDRFEFSMKKKF